MNDNHSFDPSPRSGPASPQPQTSGGADAAAYQADRELDRRLDLALASAPELSIPPDFASRLAASLPAVPVPSPRRSYGRVVAFISAAVLLAFVVALAAAATRGSAAAQWAELLFAIELAVVTLTAGPWRGSLRRLL